MPFFTHITHDGTTDQQTIICRQLLQITWWALWSTKRKGEMYQITIKVLFSLSCQQMTKILFGCNKDKRTYHATVLSKENQKTINKCLFLYYIAENNLSIPSSRQPYRPLYVPIHERESGTQHLEH